MATTGAVALLGAVGATWELAVLDAGGTAWTAGAADREGDQIFYKFLLNGRDMTGWSTSPTWQWPSGGQAPGDYRVRVLVRDGMHAPEDSFDDYKESTFTLLSEIDLQIVNLQRK